MQPAPIIPAALRCALVVALLLYGAQSLCAQERTVSLAPWLGYEFGVPLELERTPGVYDWCDVCDGTGRSREHRGRGGVALLIPMGDDRAATGDPPLSLDLRLGLFFNDGAFTSNPYTDLMIDGETGTVRAASQRFTVSSVAGGLGLDARLRYKPLDGVGVGAGGWLDYRFLSLFIRRAEIVDTADVVYVESGTRRRIIDEGEGLGNGGIGGGVTLGVDVAIDLPVVRIIPELALRLDLPALLDGIGYRALSPGLSLRFAPRSPDRPPLAPPAPPTPPLPTPPTLPRLAVAVDLFAIDPDDGTPRQEAVLRTHRTLYRLHESVEREEVVERFEGPPIGLDPTFDAAAGVRWWGLTIRKGEEEIARLTSDHPERELALRLRYDDGADAALPLVAEMIVEDSLGAMTAARDSLPFRAVDPVRATLDSVGERFDRIEDRWSVALAATPHAALLRAVADTMRATDGELLLLIPTGSAPAHVEELSRAIGKSVGRSVAVETSEEPKSGEAIIVITSL